MPHAGPLTDEELDELDAFLMSDDTPDESMDVSMLDGFLTALVIGPNTLMPSQWLPVVWGESKDETMVWQSAEQAQRIMELLMRHMNSLVAIFQAEPESYEPLIYTNTHEGGSVDVIEEWCMGFMRAVELDAEGWKALLDDETAHAFLFPMMLYGTETGWKELESNPELADRHENFVDSLADCVLAIHDFWLPQRKAKTTVRHEGAKPGRNDPCPCGSGKKFKKCCGDIARMH